MDDELRQAFEDLGRRVDAVGVEVGALRNRSARPGGQGGALDAKVGALDAKVSGLDGDVRSLAELVTSYAHLRLEVALSAGTSGESPVVRAVEVRWHCGE